MKCLTGCAHTYREAREAQKEREKERNEDVNPTKERKHKSFCLAKLAPSLPDPLEGTFRQFQSQNYEKFLAMVGAGPMSINMIMRANVVLKINQVQRSFNTVTLLAPSYRRLTSVGESCMKQQSKQNL